MRKNNKKPTKKELHTVVDEEQTFVNDHRDEYDDSGITARYDVADYYRASNLRVVNYVIEKDLNSGHFTVKQIKTFVDRLKRRIG